MQASAATAAAIPDWWAGEVGGGVERGRG